MSKHICFVSDTLHTYLGSGIETGAGGAERQQYKLAQELHKKGYDVSIVTRDYNKPTRETIEGFDVWKVIPDIRGVHNAPLKTKKIVSTLKAVNADIYYVRGNPLLCIITSLFTNTFGQGKFLYQVANDSNIEPAQLAEMNTIVRQVYLIAIGRSDAVCVLTPYQRDVLLNEHKISSTVVPCGYELPPQSEIIDHVDREFILWVGRMNEDQKKPERFLDLAEALPDQEFVMIGPRDNDDPHYYDRIKKRATRIENLSFKGFVSPDKIHEYFSRATMLVNTSDYEGFGNVFLEAWRFETPVVSLHYTLHGVIDKEPVGYHAGSMKQLIKIVDNLSMNLDCRRKFGKNGRQYVHDNYSFSNVVTMYENIFDQITGSK